MNLWQLGQKTQEVRFVVWLNAIEKKHAVILSLRHHSRTNFCEQKIAML